MAYRHPLALLVLATVIAPVMPNPPVASYVFPAGGRQGETVAIKVGGLFLHEQCPFAIVGPGVTATSMLRRTDTLWFEGPLLPLPDSQRAEDYPVDMAGQIVIARDAPLGVRFGRVWTSQGAAPHVQFQVGDLPETIENEFEGDPIPVGVTAPVTINGRILPREDVDVWTVNAKKGETFTAIVHAERLGSPLDARLEVRDPAGRLIAENDDAHGLDPAVRFRVAADGIHSIHIRDANLGGGQAYVYRLSVTTSPMVDRVFPLGARRGSKTTLDLVGHGLASASKDISIPDNSPARHPLDLPGANLHRLTLDIDDLPELIEGPDSPMAPIPTPVILNGRIATAGEIDEWSIAARKDDRLTIALFARRLGSPLDGVVTILDSTGKELVKIEGDKAVEWSPPADGAFVVRVRDRFRRRGDGSFAYRLKIHPARPDFSVTVATDAVSVLRKGQAKLKVSIDRQGGFAGPVAIAAEDLPVGVSAAPLTVAANQSSADLILKADETAPITAQPLRIVAAIAREKAKNAKIKSPTDDPPLTFDRRALVAGTDLDTVMCGVGLPTPFIIKGDYDMGFASRGSPHRRRYRIERNGFDGPIEVRLADRQARHLQGVTGPTIVVPGADNEFTYEAQFSPWMEMGRTCRVCVMGTGVVEENGVQHKVSFSSTNQNEQLVAVVGPGQLALSLTRDSAIAIPGQSVAIPFQVKRGVAWKGPVTVSLVPPRHQKDVAAEPCVVAADGDRGVLTIRFGAGPLTFTMPMTVRAELIQNQKRIVAEAPLELSAD